MVQSGAVLLLRCAFRDGTAVWMLPGGGREDTEDEETCVAREVVEETGLRVRVVRLLFDHPAKHANATYVRWRTYLCAVVSGTAVPGGGEGDNAELVGVTWLPMQNEESWPQDIREDPILFPQLQAIRASLSSSS